MAITINPPYALHTHFFGPLLTLFPKLNTFRSCPKVSDADWLQLGICRALEGIQSGRDFLPSLQAKLRVPSVARFFPILQSKRRLALCAETNLQKTRSCQCSSRTSSASPNAV